MLGLSGRAADVRFGSKGDICKANRDVCFTPESRPVRCTSRCLLGPKVDSCAAAKRLFDHPSARSTSVGGKLTPSVPRFTGIFLCTWTVEGYHLPRPRHGGRCTMTYILIVAGAALAFYLAAVFIIGREKAWTCGFGVPY